MMFIFPRHKVIDDAFEPGALFCSILAENYFGEGRVLSRVLTDGVANAKVGGTRDWCVTLWVKESSVECHQPGPGGSA